MAKVIDCTSSPSVSSLKSAGVTGLIRYLTWEHYWGGSTHTGFNPKLIRPDEYNNLINNGFDVVLNWEFDAEDWLSGASGGASHAAEAVRQAIALGYPTGNAIYGSCDFNMTSSQWYASGSAYAQAFSVGIRNGGYQPGVYGPYDVLSWCQSSGFMDYFWQASMSGSWSDWRNSTIWPGVHLAQMRQATIGGMDCDINDVHQENYGQMGVTVVSREEANADTYLYEIARGQDPITGIVGADGKVITPGVPNLPWQRLVSIESKVDALTTVVSSIATQALTDAQITALATALASKLPPEMTPADVEAAVRTVLHNA